MKFVKDNCIFGPNEDKNFLLLYFKGQVFERNYLLCLVQNAMIPLLNFKNFGTRPLCIPISSFLYR